MKQLFIALLLAILLSGCDNDQRGRIDTDSQPKTDKDYQVTFLFEVDGVKVYRFYDDRYVYFTNTNGQTEYEYTETHAAGVGKHRHTYHTTHRCESINTQTEE